MATSQGRASRLAERRNRARQRRRRHLVVILVAVLVTALTGLELARRGGVFAGPEPVPQGAGGTASPPADGGVDGGGDAPPDYPETGPGTWSYASGEGPVLGGEGKVRTFRVAVEKEMGVKAADFAATVEAILGDERGWTADGKRRFQRVAKGEPADFTLYLATPGTSEQMCAEGGLHTGKFASCRLPGEVIINVERWFTAVPGYGAPLAEYRAYAVNHELGHQLGHGHEACPGSGRPAPVMQQQTFGLGGCVANGWPYLRGQRHTGPKIP